MAANKEENTMQKEKHEHIVNLYVSYDIKSALEQLACRRNQSLASVIRRVFRIGIPILHRLWDTEDQLLQEQSELLSELAGTTGNAELREMQSLNEGASPPKV
jgi:hypothetical protein